MSPSNQGCYKTLAHPSLTNGLYHPTGPLTYWGIGTWHYYECHSILTPVSHIKYKPKFSMWTGWGYLLCQTMKVNRSIFKKLGEGYIPHPPRDSACVYRCATTHKFTWKHFSYMYCIRNNSTIQRYPLVHGIYYEDTQNCNHFFLFRLKINDIMLQRKFLLTHICYIHMVLYYVPKANFEITVILHYHGNPPLLLN